MTKSTAAQMIVRRVGIRADLWSGATITADGANLPVRVFPFACYLACRRMLGSGADAA